MKKALYYYYFFHNTQFFLPKTNKKSKSAKHSFNYSIQKSNFIMACTIEERNTQ